jgi:phage terminase Nu1 subunit (DNA packaging protein)
MASSTAVQVSRRQLAGILGVTPNAVTKYVERGMPVAHVGGGRGHESAFDLAAVFAWWREESNATKSSARDVYYGEMTEKTRLENAERRGELHSIEVCTAESAQVITAAKERFLGLSGRCRQVGILTTPDQEDQLDAIVREVLTELAQGLTVRRSATARKRRRKS